MQDIHDKPLCLKHETDASMQTQHPKQNTE